MAKSDLNDQWQHAAWPTLSPQMQQVAYLSGLGWKPDDIADELFLAPLTVTRMRDTIRRMSTKAPTNYEPFAQMTSRAIVTLTSIYTPSPERLVQVAGLPDHHRLMLQKIADGMTISAAGREVYGYEIETAQIENLVTKTLGLTTRTQLQTLMMRPENDAEADAAVATGQPITPAA